MDNLVQSFPDSVARHLSAGSISGDISSGGVSGGISGGISGSISGGISGDRIAGTLEVVLDVHGELTQEIGEDVFKRAIAGSLEVPLANVVKLSVSETVHGARRLSAVMTKNCTVAYEVIVPSSMVIDGLIERANRIAVSGSVFRQVLIATDGVQQVRQISEKVPAHKSVDEIPSQTEADKNWKAWSLIAGSICWIILCLASIALLIRNRKDENKPGDERPERKVSSKAPNQIFSQV